MADRRSAGAESIAVFEQTLDRLLAGSPYGQDVQDQVVDAVRNGASTVQEVVEQTGLAQEVVERAIAVLVANGRLVTEAPPPPLKKAARSRTRTAAAATRDKRTAAAG